MRSWMICLVAGIASATWQPELIPFFGCISIAFVIITLILYPLSAYRVHVIFYLVGFLVTTLWGHWQLLHRLPEELLRTDWDISGEVVGLPQFKNNTVRFDLKVKAIKPHGFKAKVSPKIRKVRLSWYQPSEIIRGGQQIHLITRLKPPHGLVNPNGFDYERWLLIRGIDATGYVRHFLSSVPAVPYSVSAVRESINELITKYHADSAHQALFKALITGDKQGLSDDNWEVLRRSGTVHLAVISGLHIGFIALVGWWAGRLFSLVCNAHSARSFPYFSSLLFAGSYMLVAGADLPTQRAFLMISALLLSGWRLFYLDHWTRWWIAMAAVLLLSPLAIWETGFWLSFGAVACLIWLGQLYHFRWQDGVKLQFMLLAGMLPLYLYFFSAFSLFAPLVNLVAIPLVAILVPLEFLNLVLAGLLTPVVNLLANMFWGLVQYAGDVQSAYVELAGLNDWVLLCSLVAAVIIVMPKSFVPKPLALAFLLPLLTGVEQGTEKGFSAWIYDVGQGLGVLIKVEGYHLLYDTGPSYKSGGTAFQRAIEPHFSKAGIRALDVLVLSHDDNDHVGGYGHIQRNYEIKKLITSFSHPDSYQTCREGQNWTENGVTFRFLAGGVELEDNERSCVMQISYGDCSLLLPGDIGAEKERQLKINGPVTWLVAAHHGSRYSTSSSFMNKIKPEAVIFSAGYGNAFNHPHPDVVKRVEWQGGYHLNTAQDGAIQLSASPEHGCKTSTVRNEQKRFWRSFESM